MTPVPSRTDDPWAPHDGWAVLAHPPGVRDLGTLDPWQRSLARSRARRAAAEARRPGLQRATTARVSLALATATALTPAAEIAAAAPATAADVGTGMLQAGARGAAVKAVQEKLGIAADGVFGKKTRSAVKRFQRANGLEADGVVGPLTAAKLGVTLGGATERAATRSAPTGDRGERVVLTRSQTKQLQRAVGASADGAWGPRSRSALKRYERRQGLPADGRPDTVVLAKLGISTAPSSGSAPEGDEDQAQPRSLTAPSGSGASAAVSFARSAIGTPYGSGGNGPGSYDCSGLTVAAFKAAGVALPRTSYAQYGVGTSVTKGAIQAGDLVFFDSNGAGASHVGVATGPTTVISATTRGVMEHSISSGYWAEHYVGARRVG